MLKHKIIKDYSEFINFHHEWNSLLDKSRVKGRVFQTHDWLDVWYRHYRYPCSLYITVLYDGDDIVAIAPFCLVPRRKFGMSGTALSFMGISMSDYCEIIYDPSYPDQQEIYRTLFDVLEKYRKHWSLVALDEIPENSDLFRYVSNSLVHKFSGISVGSECSYVDTSRPWTEYSTAIFSKGMAKKKRGLSKFGEVKFGQVSDVRDVQPFMSELFETHIRRWSGTGDTSRFLESNQQDYFLDMAQTLFPRDMVDLSYLSVNGRKVAFHFGFKDAERLYVYLHTFDPEYQEYSIGRLFLYELIAHSYGTYGYVDFLRGSEAYKEQFDLVKDTNYTFGLYKSGIHMWVHSKFGDKVLV